MKTKLVYVITSSLDDVYWEEGWVSAWSARYHNPEAHIVLVCDKDTLDTAEGSYRAKSLELFDEKITVDFNPEVRNKQRSRWIKTNLREYVKGDFLFIDTDTVITDKLDDIDDWDIDLGMVNDEYRLQSQKDYNVHLYEMAYGQTISLDVPYFNSGVIFAKDTKKVYTFYQRWHKNWRELGNVVDYTDQTPLTRTNMELGNPISKISGIYNSQISFSIKYLHLAKIMHFIHNWWNDEYPVSPFLGKTIYQMIKDRQGMGEDIQNLVINCKSSFDVKSVPLFGDVIPFLSSTTIRFVLLPLFLKKRKLYYRVDKFVHFLCRILYRLHIRL